SVCCRIGLMGRLGEWIFYVSYHPDRHRSCIWTFYRKCTWHFIWLAHGGNSVFEKIDAAVCNRQPSRTKACPCPAVCTLVWIWNDTESCDHSACMLFSSFGKYNVSDSP